MAKIGILTQPLGLNYGGVLQAYALQQILIESGHNVITINRVYNAHSKIKIALSKLKHLLLNPAAKKTSSNFSEYEIKYISKNILHFINEKILVSEVIDRDKKMFEHFEYNHYDALIVGSDQVWRPKYSPNIYNFYFDFIKNNNCIKRMAYAASFGVSNWEYDNIQTEKCKALVNKFNAVSVREDSGVELCKQNFKINADLVLDPTMLLSKSHYISLIETENTENTGKLYTYILDDSLEKNELINQIASDLGLSKFSNQPNESLKYMKSPSVDDYVFPKIDGWIKGFYDASFIVTDSFHGMVFSILFNKPFLAIVNEDRGAARFKSLLSQFNLENRLIDTKVTFHKDLLNNPINYDDVNDKLEKLRAKSMDFINRNI